MVEDFIPIYVGLGLALIQGFHTWSSSYVYHQKQVRWLQHWVKGFSRRDPGNRDLVHPPIPPWSLPHIQMAPDRTPWYARMLGLHATNLFYCYAMSLVYGLLGWSIFEVLGNLHPLSHSGLLGYGAAILGLSGFSFWFVGSGFEITLLEGAVLFNAFFLTVMTATPINPGTAVMLLQLIGALTIGPLIFWLRFQYEEENLGYGKWAPVYNAIVPMFYAEFFAASLALAILF